MRRAASYRSISSGSSAKPVPGDLRLVRVEPAAQLRADRQRRGDRRQRLAGAQQFVLRLLLQRLQQRRQPVPLGVPAVLGGRRQLLLQRGRRAADRGHLGRGDLRQHLAARAARLGEGAVRAGRARPAACTSRASASCRTVSTASISRRTSSRARASRSYARGVRPAAAGRRTALRAGRQKASGSETTCSRSAVRVRGDPLQVVARRVLAGAYADGVRELAGALQLGGEQIDPGGQRRPDRVGGDDHVQRASRTARSSGPPGRPARTAR